MNGRERLVLASCCGLLLGALVLNRAVAALVGGALGATAGVLLRLRLRRFGARVDARLGSAPMIDRPFAVGRPVRRFMVLLALVAGLFVLTVLLPGVGGRMFVGGSAALTAGWLAVTALGRPVKGGR